MGLSDGSKRSVEILMWFDVWLAAIIRGSNSTTPSHPVAGRAHKKITSLYDMPEARHPRSVWSARIQDTAVRSAEAEYGQNKEPKV